MFAGVLAAGAPAAGAASLHWSASPAFDAGMTPTAVSCPSEALCVGVDAKGNALSTLDPTSSPPSWTAAAIDPGGAPLQAVSCAPAGPCVAVDAHGSAFANLEPGSSSWSPASIDGGNALTGVSCPSASLCVAVDHSGNVLTTGSPGSGHWSLAAIDPGHGLRAVSCSSPSLCVAVDDGGEVLWSVDPAGGAPAWHARTLDVSELTGVSCAGGECVAVDGAGVALVSADPTAPEPTWSLTPIDGERLTGVSCATSGLCVAVDAQGLALASDDPLASTPSWSGSSVDSAGLAGISCLPGGLCTALDTAGRSLSGRVAGPEATTLLATQVTSSSATLAGAVNPNDAVLGDCAFEYGTTLPYSSTVPCSLLPTANGGIQSVAATIAGLAPNTTYHYRVTASSPAGAGVGADMALTTALSSQVALVYPHPSITGTPAPGQRLTCHPGTPSGASVQLLYAWVRDLIPIPASGASAYTVKGQDSGHHLQCQVTATDGGGSATAKSAFVTVPVGGVPSATGETAVGVASFRKGSVLVPLACSPQAGGGCQIALRVAAVETLSGKRVVAVAARSPRRAHRSASALRQRTVTLASLRLHLAAGARSTAAVALTAAAKRLLASLRRFTADVYVSGTVIGVIEAQLAHQVLVIGAPARGASSHGAHGR